jgi:DNA-binding response OmpR family regulator
MRIEVNMAEATRSTRVLVVDDEASIRDIVRGFLEQAGMSVDEAADGPSAVQAARETSPDVVVLDIMLPGFDGLEVLRQIRAFSDPYVLMLTARNEEVDRIVGLSVGADDYLTKPFSPRELVARVQAILRRRRGSMAQSSERLRSIGDLQVDLAARTVTVNGRQVELTAHEFDLLAALVRDPGVVLTRQQLLDTVWGLDYFGDDHVIDVHIANLRRKLALDTRQAVREVGQGGRIETVRGVGYRLAREER